MLLMFAPQHSSAQTTLYTTNFGTVAGTAGTPLGNASPALSTHWRVNSSGTDTLKIAVQYGSTGNNGTSGGTAAYTGASGFAYLGEENSVNYVNTAGTSETTDAS